jgi:tRNA(Ile2) C34 agmatinyltransferase TiaS
MEDPICPTCKVPLQSEGNSLGAIGPNDRLDDPALERWNLFHCPKCRQGYRRNSKTGELHRATPGGG